MTICLDECGIDFEKKNARERKLAVCWETAFEIEILDSLERVCPSTNRKKHFTRGEPRRIDSEMDFLTHFISAAKHKAAHISADNDDPSQSHHNRTSTNSIHATSYIQPDLELQMPPRLH
jgi:hypothetical protein